MKNLILMLFFITSSTLMSNELSWVDEQIQAIKPPRKGMNSSAISSIKDPFIFLNKNKNEKDSKTVKVEQKVTVANAKQTVKTKVVNIPLSLSIILNNSAMIDGKWYKVGDFIQGYKIAKINKVSVVLNNRDKKLLLSTKSISNKLKFQK